MRRAVTARRTECAVRSISAARARSSATRLARSSGADDHVLLMTLHHIVSDGWSLGVLYRELGALYAASFAARPPPLPALPVQYADYAAWQRAAARRRGARRAARVLEGGSTGAPRAIDAPRRSPAPARAVARGGRVAFARRAPLVAG